VSNLFAIRLEGCRQSIENGAMCLGIPMQVEKIDDLIARCQARGVFRDVSLLMLQGESVFPGDYVMVSLGYALQKMTEQEARSAWEIYDEMLAAEHA